jgi:hypothetical protein
MNFLWRGTVAAQISKKIGKPGISRLAALLRSRPG